MAKAKPPGLSSAPADQVVLHDATSKWGTFARDEFFIDGREGTDRWGRERAKLWACGTGFGEDDYVCPLYLEESCPGYKNPGDRTQPNWLLACSMNCGECGGGGISATMAYCGQAKGAPMNAHAIAEMGGSLRLDRYAPPELAPVEPFPVSYFPIVEWGGKKWMDTLNATWGGSGFPMIGTTMKTVVPGGGSRRVTPLRDRLGGFEGQLLVNGLTKDDLLDDAWDDRKRLFRFCREAEVDYMVTPQFSTYATNQSFMWVYNANRVFRWYEECIEAGFEKVVLDMPPGRQPQWLLDEWYAFANRANVRYVGLAYQQYKDRGGMRPEAIWGAGHLHKNLPPECALILFGLGTPQRIATMSRLFPGRQVIFSTVEAYARAAFFEIVPWGNAPPGMKKDAVFTQSVCNMVALTDKLLGRESVAPPGPMRERSTTRSRPLPVRRSRADRRNEEDV